MINIYATFSSALSLAGDSRESDLERVDAGLFSDMKLLRGGAFCCDSCSVIGGGAL